MGFFLFFLKIPVWLGFYARVFHVYISMYNACSNYYHRVQKLKLLIKEQTDLDPHYQELFYENLPYKPGQAEVAAKLPTTTVS